jgi:hypothetical protein
VHLRATLERECSGRGDNGFSRHRARDVYYRINNDEGGEQPPPFARASQNVAAVAILLRTMPAPSTVEGQQVRDELRGLLECATVQQAESSASQRREPEAKPSMAPSQQEREPLVHPKPRGAPERNKAPSVRARLGNDPDAQVILDVRRHQKDDGAARGYHPRRGGRYDSEEDRSPSPKPPGPRFFSEAIRRARFLAQFRQLANIIKYFGEMNPDMWLANYRLVC